MSLHWKPRVVMTPALSSPRLSLWWQVNLQGPHWWVGITTTFDFRYYSWSSEHQDYDCNTLPLTTISGKWISFVLPCFKYASSGDRQRITLSGSLWMMNQFLVLNESQVCESCVSTFRNKLYWFIQIHLDKPYCAAIEPESPQWCSLDAALFWHIMAYLWGCKILWKRQIFCSITYKKWF